MNTKTPGQIAEDAFMRARPIEAWESAAAAVLQDYDANYDVKQAFKAGKEIQCKRACDNDDKWVTLRSNHPSWSKFFEYRVAPEPAWTLPAPPEGREWHRNDWTAEMLPEGYRPLLLCEMTGKECNDVDWMNKPADSVWRNGADFLPVLQGSGFFRTRRPLPPIHKVEIKIPKLTLESGKFSFATN
jgi:hypothetical protein